jgi:hypothetical protein
MAEDEMNCALCVSSLDSYADLWAPFFNLVDLYWPDCPFPLYLGVNERRFDHPRVTTTHAGLHDNWSDRAREHLSAIPTKYVLMMLDDWFLTEPVDTKRIQHLLTLLERFDGHMLRLVPDPKPDHAIAGHPSIGLMGIGTLNRTNTQATLWRKDTLLRLLRPGESLWEFEVHGSVRSNSYSGGIFSVWRPALSYEGVISRGKWERGAARRYSRMNVGCNFDVRQTKTIAEASVLGMTRTIGPLIRRLLPMHLRQRAAHALLGPGAYPNDLS